MKQTRIENVWNWWEILTQCDSFRHLILNILQTSTMALTLVWLLTQDLQTTGGCTWRIFAFRRNTKKSSQFFYPPKISFYILSCIETNWREREGEGEGRRKKEKTMDIDEMIYYCEQVTKSTLIWNMVGNGILTTITWLSSMHLEAFEGICKKFRGI